ncbi:hypothetical protein MM221_00500 [Salipaludibacillus sp. LMS25]|uniref:hypothetical protein n=1 Tax=Salipaludibacillus sp. LMS25 TaxID=2924031 RepID=UPI0020D0679F|nr:hypothetical protein [Salipaludibacillus sp. LMS25]UTR15118.1 hypothetical protein MM221_00500 [Salipaludibacillus sp. LMS25]
MITDKCNGTYFCQSSSKVESYLTKIYKHGTDQLILMIGAMFAWKYHDAILWAFS